MYDVSAQGIDEFMINVHYYCYVCVYIYICIYIYACSFLSVHCDANVVQFVSFLKFICLQSNIFADTIRCLLVKH